MTQGLTSGIIPSPLVDPIAWSSITVAGITVGIADGSGMVKVRRCARPYKWQKKDAAGQDGETKTYRGKKPPDFEIEFHLWTDKHFQSFQALATAAFLYDVTKIGTANPVDIYHPALAIVGITQITVDEFGAPEQQGDRLLWIATIKVCEFLPPIAQNATATPAGAGPGATPPGTPPATTDDALQQQIAQAQQDLSDEGSASPTDAGLP